MYDTEEMECLLANYINKVRSFTESDSGLSLATFSPLIPCTAQGLVKGYISHTHQLVVLSKEKPFPW